MTILYGSGSMVPGKNHSLVTEGCVLTVSNQS